MSEDIKSRNRGCSTLARDPTNLNNSVRVFFLGSLGMKSGGLNKFSTSSEVASRSIDVAPVQNGTSK